MPDSPTRRYTGMTDPRRTARPGVGMLHLVGAIVLGTGLLSVLGSLFLPWLTSGSSTRTSFQLMALADRFRFFDAWWYRLAPAVWPYWGPAVVVVLIVLVLRLRRTGSVLGLVVCGLAVVVGSLVLIYGGGRSVGGVRLVALGPTIMVIGGALGCVGGLGLLWKSSTRIMATRRP